MIREKYFKLLMLFVFICVILMVMLDLSSNFDYNVKNFGSAGIAFVAIGVSVVYAYYSEKEMNNP